MNALLIAGILLFVSVPFLLSDINTTFEDQERCIPEVTDIFSPKCYEFNKTMTIEEMKNYTSIVCNISFYECNFQEANNTLFIGVKTSKGETKQIMFKNNTRIIKKI